MKTNRLFFIIINKIVQLIKKTSEYNYVYSYNAVCENIFSMIENRVLRFSFIYKIAI